MAALRLPTHYYESGIKKLYGAITILDQYKIGSSALYLYIIDYQYYGLIER